MAHSLQNVSVKRKIDLTIFTSFVGEGTSKISLRETLLFRKDFDTANMAVLKANTKKIDPYKRYTAH